jgi:hypothetical protein
MSPYPACAPSSPFDRKNPGIARNRNRSTGVRLYQIHRGNPHYPTLHQPAPRPAPGERSARELEIKQNTPVKYFPLAKSRILGNISYKKF